MTRAEHYLAGKAEGERMAEIDLRDHRHDLDEDLKRNLAGVRRDSRYRAFLIGCRRGYRLTVARFEAGELTFEMFEMGPR